MKAGSAAATKSTIELLAWNGDNRFFAEVLPFTSSPDETLKAASIKALASLAGPDDQAEMIELLSVTENPVIY